MTGPEHVAEVEEHLAYARAAEDLDIERMYLAYAQVHATLALTMATADPDSFRAPAK